MSKRTLVTLVLILAVVFVAKGVIAKPNNDVPAYKIQQDQGVQAYKSSNVSKI